MYQKIKLYSKRNEVYRIINTNEYYISKLFCDAENFKKELELLLLLKRAGANVPKVIKSSKNELLMEDLGDMTLLSWYESLERQNSYDYEQTIMKLCSWLKNFYNITFNCFKESYILVDVNFRNFLINEDEIYGIDFEQSGFGKIETDAGKLAAYAFTYNPAATKWKKRFHDTFIEILCKELQISKEIILIEEQKELKAIKNRRKY